MDLISTAQVLSAGFAWRRTRLKAAGRSLVSALSSSDENVRTMAGMMLTQAGERSIHLLEETIAAGRGTELHEQVLKDIRPTVDAGDELDAMAASDDPALAEAAKRARELLDQTGGLGGEGRTGAN